MSMSRETNFLINMDKISIERIKKDINSAAGQAGTVIKKLKELLMTDMSFLTLSFFNKTIKMTLHSKSRIIIL